MNLSKIYNCGKLKNYSKDEMICLEKNPGETAFLLLKGEAKVVLSSFDDRTKEIASIGVGTIFGEMSLIMNTPRSATVIAACDETTVLEIGKDDFLSLMKTEPELAYNLLRTMYIRMENQLSLHERDMIAYISELRREEMYAQIGKINKEQFVAIVLKDENHALRLLKYLGIKLLEIDKKVAEYGK